MPAKTERVTILTTPAFKQFLSLEAEKAGVSISELIRERCSQEPLQSDDEVYLQALVAQVNESTQNAKKALNKGLRDAKATLKALKKTKVA